MSDWSADVCSADLLEQIVHPAIKAKVPAAAIDVERQEQVVLPHVADVEEGGHLGIGVGREQGAILVAQDIAVADLAIIGGRPADAEIVELPAQRALRAIFEAADRKSTRLNSRH